MKIHRYIECNDDEKKCDDCGHIMSLYFDTWICRDCCEHKAVEVVAEVNFSLLCIRCGDDVTLNYEDYTSSKKR